MPKSPAFFSRVTDSFGKLRTRLGDLWWFTVILFIAQRLSDVVNAVAGLWLVPKYVPMEELGAVLPLANIGGMLGLPLGLLSIPLLKFLNQYIQEGAFGKAKSLLRDTLLLAAVFLLLLLAFSPVIMPAVFDRMRIEDGSLSILIVTSGVVAALNPIFQTTLQALKRFNALTWLGLELAVVRFGTMSVCLPIRGLSGYFVGQIVPILAVITSTLWIVRDKLILRVRCEPYFQENWSKIARYSIAPIIYSLSMTFAGTVTSVVIRRCLPDVESAGYYMISRFAEISMALGLTCAVILFPLAAEEKVSKKGRSSLLIQSMLFSMAGGIIFSLICTPLVNVLFTQMPKWQVYLPYIPHLAALGILYSIASAVHCYYTYQCAKSAFKFVPIFVAILVFQGAFLYCLTGYSFFAPWLPESWLTALASWNPCRLSVVIGVSMLFYLLLFAYALKDALWPKVKKQAHA